MPNASKKPVNIGLIGLGFAGTHLHLPPLLQNPLAELVHVADADAKKVEAFQAAHGDIRCKTSESWEAVVADPAVEAVFVATPTPTHLPIVQKALEAGKHVFCEKPIANNLQDAHKMLDAQKKHPDRLVMIGQVLRYWDEYVKAHELVKHGKIGEPRVARASRAVPLPLGWYAQEEMSGGVIVDLSLHDIDFLVWTLGEVESVFAQGANCSGTKSPGFVDYVQTQLNFKSGAIAHVEAIWATAKNYPFTTSLEISGTEGLLTMDNSPANSSLEATERDKPMFRILPSEYNGYFFEEDAFLRAVQDGAKRAPIAIEDVVHPLEVVMAAKQSIRTKEIVKVSSIRETVGVKL